jgi:uncharacterized protein involved in tolerance to divalent cations
MGRNSAIIVISTVAGTKQAQSLARALVRGRLAACCSHFPVRSQYMWQGKHQNSREVMIFIKTSRQQYRAVEAFIKKHHAYQLPEIIAIRTVRVEKRYLAWMMEGVTK